jgi:predicted transposase/invertase (TIGR01784 family)
MIQRLNPRIDIAFKKIFGVEENKDLLISLINSIVGPDDQVSTVTLMNPYNVQNFKTDKLSILDIKAHNQDGKLFNIEMQITNEGDYSQRALYYWSKMYAQQMRSGQKYNKLVKTIGIHILNFSCINDALYHHEFHIKDKDSNDRFFHHFEIHSLELQKFCSEDEQITDLVKKIQTSLDMWMTFLIRNDVLSANHLPPELDNDYLKKAITVLDVMNLDAVEREIYENREKFLMAEANGLEHQYTIGKAEGIAEGELNAKREMAIKMLNSNLADDTILMITGYTQRELDQIKAELL